MSGESADLNTKYQKLATEYAKLRSQVIILKKGVLDEQEKSTQISDQLHDRETQLRKHESEMEGIQFRNQQLTRRVNVLQDEIDNLQTKPKSKWRGSNDEKERAERVINEELVAKITENARLHATLDDIEKQYETTIQSLQSRIQDLEREKTVLVAEKKHKDQEVQESSQYLVKENDELRSRVTVLERDLAVRSKQNESMEVQISVLLQKNRSLESVARSDFSAQYCFVDPAQSRLTEENQRSIASLTERLAESLARLEEVEKDREHWKLEFQLSQIKLQKQIQNPGTPTQVDDNLLDNRELEIKSAFESRLGELVAQRILSDSKSTSFYLECEALNFKVVSLEEEMAKIQEELTAKSEMLIKGEEEIRTLQLNYEEQLSVMSDHLAEMNSKLATQEDTIIHLRQGPDLVEGKKKKK